MIERKNASRKEEEGRKKLLKGRILKRGDPEQCRAVRSEVHPLLGRGVSEEGEGRERFDAFSRRPDRLSGAEEGKHKKESDACETKKEKKGIQRMGCKT